MNENIDLFENTVTFSTMSGNKDTNKEMLRWIYEALLEKGYNPINQMAGFIISGDPTYITNFRGARSLAGRVDREEILAEMIRAYLGI